jgi:diacylglycerol kinase family enzyme
MSSVSSPLIDIDIERCILMEESGKTKINDHNCSLGLTTSQLKITLSHNKKCFHYDISNIIGARNRSNNKKSCFGKSDGYLLEIFLYNIKKSNFCGNEKLRFREVISILFSDVAENDCENWANAINLVTSTLLPINIQTSDVKNENKNIKYDIPKRQKFLVFVNPVSGKGTATKIWESVVKDMYIEANIDVKLIITTHANHALDYVQSIEDPFIYDAIVPIGGDGMIYEVINGLAKRSEGQICLKKIPISPLPGGSANGLVKSLLFESGEDYSIINAVFVSIKGIRQNMDLSLVQTSLKNYNSFLIFGWGLISDVDILSESLRWMGETRMTVAAVYFILKQNKYRGRLSMYTGKTNDDNNKLDSSNRPLELPSLDTPIVAGNGWEVIEDDFTLVWAVQTTHAGSEIYSGPGKKMDDGLFMIYVVTEAKKTELLALLLSIDTGKHVDLPVVKTYYATAYRLEPLTEEGIYTLDGEVVEYGPIQGIMSSGSASIKKFAR